MGRVCEGSERIRRQLPVGRTAGREFRYHSQRRHGKGGARRFRKQPRGIGCSQALENRHRCGAGFEAAKLHFAFERGKRSLFHHRSGHFQQRERKNEIL